MLRFLQSLPPSSFAFSLLSIQQLGIELKHTDHTTPLHSTLPALAPCSSRIKVKAPAMAYEVIQSDLPTPALLSARTTLTPSPLFSHNDLPAVLNKTRMHSPWGLGSSLPFARNYLPQMTSVGHFFTSFESVETSFLKAVYYDHCISYSNRPILTRIDSDLPSPSSFLLCLEECRAYCRDSVHIC